MQAGKAERDFEHGECGNGKDESTIGKDIETKEFNDNSQVLS